MGISPKQRDRAPKEVERLNAALLALGKLGNPNGRRGRTAKKRSHSQLLRARKLPQLSLLGEVEASTPQ
jgi:hypothetical protein